MKDATISFTIEIHAEGSALFRFSDRRTVTWERGRFVHFGGDFTAAECIAMIEATERWRVPLSDAKASPPPLLDEVPDPATAEVLADLADLRDRAAAARASVAALTPVAASVHRDIQRTVERAERPAREAAAQAERSRNRRAALAALSLVAGAAWRVALLVPLVIVLILVLIPLAHGDGLRGVADFARFLATGE